MQSIGGPFMPVCVGGFFILFGYYAASCSRKGHIPMAQGIVREICIAPARRAPMVSVEATVAIAGRGLLGDRYAEGTGSYNEGNVGKRQVVIMHAHTFARQGAFTFIQSRRGILIDGDEIELTWLFAKSMQAELRALQKRLQTQSTDTATPDENAFLLEIGEALFKIVGYCDPCHVPTKYAGKDRDQADQSFRKLFWECGGVICDVVRGGMIKVGSPVIAVGRGY